MRILRLIPYFADAFGGPVRHVKALTKELNDAGHETVIYTTNLRSKKGDVSGGSLDGYDVRAFPVKWGIGDYFYTPGMKRALRSEEFDIIHAHCYRNYQADVAAWLSQEKSRPLIFTAHGTLPKLPGLRDAALKGLYDAVTRREVLKTSRRLIALSQEEIAQYRYFGVALERIVRVYHGIDTNLFSPSDSGEAVREKLGIGSDPVILYAGRLHKRKGLRYLLLAFEIVKSYVPEAHLVICGPDYGYRRTLRRLVAESEHEEDIIMTGHVANDRMPEIYNACDVFALPSKHEVFGHVLAEAAACGRAIVATRWGWADEFFENGKDSILIDEYGDVPSLAEALRTLLLEKDLRAEVGDRARRKVVERLSWPTCAQAHAEVYRLARMDS